MLDLIERRWEIFKWRKKKNQKFFLYVQGRLFQEGRRLPVEVCHVTSKIPQWQVTFFYLKLYRYRHHSFIILFVNNTFRPQTQTGTKCCRVSFRWRNAPCYQVRLLLFFLFFCCLFFLLFLCLFASSSSLPPLLYEKLAVTNWCFFFFWETYWLIPFNLNLKMTIAVQGAVKLVFFLRQTKWCPR